MTPTSSDFSRPAWSLPGSAPVEVARPELPTSADERFEPRAELGGGGMGRVRLVRDHWLARLVAVKEPVTELDARRLWREAHIAARLEHPGIVPIYDLGLGASGTPWYAMRVVRGRSLAELLRTTGGAEERLRLLRPLLAACEAVGFAHDQQIVHRDIKPDNLMIGAFGEMQVIDWGLAQAPDVPDADLGSAGTLSYMAPEQARGEPVDARADVWSLGAVLCEVVTGLGIRGDVPAEALLDAARRGQRRPMPKGVSRELADIIRRATAPDRTARYPDAKALADDLERFLDGRRVLAHTYSSGELLRRLVRAWRIPLIVLAASLLVLAGVVIAGVSRIRSERDQAQANLALSRVREAQHALADERHGEAELLASLALTSPDPLVAAEARGVLAAVGSKRPVRTELGRLSCEPVDLVFDRAVCRDRESIMSWRGGRLLTARALPNQGVVLLDEGRVIAALSETELTLLDADTAETIETLANPCRTAFGQQLEAAPDRRTALTWHNHCAAVISRDGVTLLPAQPCEGSALNVITATRSGERFAGACSDGSLVLIEPGVAARRLDARFGTSRTPPLVTALAFVGRDVLIAGSADGTIERVDLAPALQRTRLPSQHGLVRRIRVADDDARALVLADASAPLVIDLERRAVTLRLPIRTQWSAASFDAEGRAFSASSDADAGSTALERWDFGGLLPRALTFPDGVTAVAYSPDARFVAVGDGARLVVLDGERRTVANHTWQDSIIKTIGFDRAGRLVAHGLGDKSVRAFDPYAPLPAYAVPESIWRRVAVLADGSAVVSNYQHQQFLLRPGQPWEELGHDRLVDLVTSGDGLHLAMVDEAGVVRCATGFETHRAAATCAHVEGASALAIDGDHVFVVERRGVSRRARSHAGEADLLFRAPQGELLSVAVGGGLVAAGARDGSVWVWRAGDADAWAVVRAHEGRVDSLAFSPDASVLVAGGWDGVTSFIAPHALDDRSEIAERVWGLSADAAAAHRGSAR